MAAFDHSNTRGMCNWWSGCVSRLGRRKRGFTYSRTRCLLLHVPRGHYYSRLLWWKLCRRTNRSKGFPPSNDLPTPLTAWTVPTAHGIFIAPLMHNVVACKAIAHITTFKGGTTASTGVLVICRGHRGKLAMWIGRVVPIGTTPLSTVWRSLLRY